MNEFSPFPPCEFIEGEEPYCIKHRYPMFWDEDDGWICSRCLGDDWAIENIS